MSFPSSPVDKQISVVNSITYQYSTSTNTWTRLQAVFTASSITVGGVTTATSTNTGAAIVAGGLGVGGALNVAGQMSVKLTGSTADGTNSIGYMNVLQNVQSTSYTLVAGDAGKNIYNASGSGVTYTIPANATVPFAVGTTVNFINMASGATTIAIASDTMVQSGTTATSTSTISLAQYGVATALKVTSTSWLVNISATGTGSGSGTTTAATVTPSDDYLNLVSLLVAGTGTNTVSGNTSTFIDSSINNFPVTVSGTPTQGTFSPFSQTGWSNYFNGSTSKITMPYNANQEPGANPFTIEFFWYPTVGAVHQWFFGGTTDLWISLDYASTAANTIGVLVGNGTSAWNIINSVQTTGVPTINAWNHIAFGRSGGNWAVWLNGVKVFTLTGTTTSIGTKTGGFLIGSHPTNGYYTSGYISNFRYVVGTDVYGVNNSTITVPTSPLTAITNTVILTCQSPSFKDNSTNNVAITPVSPTSVQPFSPFNPVTATGTSNAKLSGTTGYSSAYFNGSSSVLTVPYSSNLMFNASNFTIECWFYVTSLAAQQSITQCNSTGAGSNTAQNIIIQTSGQIYGVAFTPSVNQVFSPFNVTINQWYHIALVRNGTSLTLYLNGIAGTSVNMGSAAVNSNTSMVTQIGAGYQSGTTVGQYLTGYITNFRQVIGTAVYTSNFVPSTAPLTAITNTALLTCQSPTFVDNSTNNFAITNNAAKPVPTMSPFTSLYGYTFTPYTGSVYFNGSTDYLSVGTASNWNFLNNGLTSWTIEAWLYPTASVPVGNVVLCATDSASTASGMQIGIGQYHANDLQLGFYNGTSGQYAVVYTTAAAITTNQWNHVAITFNSSTKVAVIYVNGVSQSLSTAGTALSSWSYSATTLNPLTIANTLNQTSAYFPGYISNFRIAQSVVYTTTFTPSTAPLTAISGTSLLTCQSGIVDNSTNAFAITQNGSPKINPLVSPFTNAVTGSSNTYQAVGNSMAFLTAGQTDYLTIPSNTALNIGSNSWTMECWVYPTQALGTYNFIYDRASSTTSATTELEISIGSTGAVTAAWYTGSTAVSTSSAASAVPPYAWTHIAVVKNGSSTQIYINGVASGTPSSNAGAANALTATAYIGGQITASRGFVGHISNFRFVNGTAVYTTNFTPSSAPLTPVTNTQLLLSGTDAAIYDQVSNNNLVTVGNAQVSNQTNPFNVPFSSSGWSNYFNGSSNLTVASSSGFAIGTTYTIEMWHYRQSNSSSGSYPNSLVLIGTQNVGVASTGFFLTYNTSGVINFYDSSNVAVITYSSATTNIPLNTWAHLAIVRSGSTVTLYVNGVSVATGTSSGTQATAQSVFIGRDTASNGGFTGYISNLRVVSGAALYTTNFTPSTAPLTAISGTILLTCQNNTLVDNSVANYALTNNGGVNAVPLSPFAPSYSWSNYFPATSAYLQFNGTQAIVAFSTSPYSVEFWVNTTLTNAGDFLLGSTGEFDFNISTAGTIVLSPRAGSSLVTATSAITANLWTHVLVTRQSTASNDTRIFVNGVLKAIGTDATNWANAGVLYLPYSAGPAFLSNVRIVKGSVPTGYQTSSTAVGTTIFTPSTSPLTTSSQGCTAANVSLLTCQSSTFVDNSPSPKTITLTGTPQVSQFPVAGFTPTVSQSLYFDGSTSYMYVPGTTPPAYAFGSGNFTVEAWIFPLATTGTGNRFIYDGRPAATQTGPCLLITTTGQLLWQYSGTNVVTTTNTPFTIGTWYHVAVSRSGTTTQLFINGVSVASATDSNSYVNSTNRPAIGGGGYNTTEIFFGYISNLRVTRYARYTGSFAISTSTSVTSPASAFPTIGTPSTYIRYTSSGTGFVNTVTTVDPYFPNTTLMLNGNGVSGATNNVVLDSSVNNFPITRNGTPTQGSFSPFGQGGWSTYFDGSSALKITSGITAVGTGSFTMEFWMYPTVAYGTLSRPISQGSGGIIIYPNSTGNIIYGVSGGTTITSVNTIPLNTWTHIAVSRVSGTSTLYINGIKDSIATDSNNFTATAINIGFDGGSAYYTGYISNFRFSANTAFYTAPVFTPSTSPLTAIPGTTVLTCQNPQFVDNAASTVTSLTVAGTPIAQQFSPFQPYTVSNNTNYSALFNGSTDYLLTSASACPTGTGSFTVEAWIYQTARSSGTGRVIDCGNGSLNLAVLSGGTIYVETSNGASGKSITGPIISLNTWYHVAAVKNGTTVSLYLNGVSQGAPFTESASLTSSGNVGIASAISGGASGIFSGYISNARIVLGSAVYTTNFTPPTAALTAISGTALLTCQSATFVDNSTNNFAITITGSPKIKPVAPTQVTNGYYSNYFNGTSAYLSITSGYSALNVAANQDFTLEAFYYPTSLSQTGGNGGIISLKAGSTNNLAIEIGGSAVLFSYGTASTGNLGTMLLNTWNHVVLVRQGTGTNNIAGYLNGAQLLTASNNAAITANGCTIGRYYVDNANYFTPGYISNARMLIGTSAYNPANTMITVPTAPFTAITNTALLTCQSSVIVDNSTNNFTLTNTGPVTVSSGISPFSYNYSTGMLPVYTTTTSTITTNYTTLTNGGYNSVSFNGSTDYLTAPTGAVSGMGTGNFTIEGWYYATSFAADTYYKRLWTFGASGITNYFGLDVLPAGTLEYRVNDAIQITASSNMLLNIWYHIALVVNNGTTTLYLNGTSVGTTSGSFNATSPGSNSLYIGAQTAGAGGFWPGYISNFRVVKGTAVYTSNFTPSTVPLTAITNTSLLACQSGGIVDNSTSTYAITASGSAKVVQTFSPFTSLSGYTFQTTGGSMYFNGSTDYLSVPSNSAFTFGTGDFTIECWVYLLTATNYTIIDTRSSGNSVSPLLYFNSSSNGLALQVAGSNVILQGAFPSLNAWHHVALSRSGTSTKIFLDGVQVGSTYTDSNNYVSGAPSIGNNSSGGGGTQILNGYISNLRVVKGTAVYTSNFAVPVAPPTPVTNTQLLLAGTNSAMLDYTGGTTLATVGSTQISTAQNVYGFGSMKFNGSTDYLSFPNSPQNAFSTGPFTIEFWIYPNSISVLQYILDTRSSATSTTGLAISISSTGFLTFTVNNATLFTSSVALTLGSWQFVSVVSTGTSLTLYINGSSPSTGSGTYSVSLSDQYMRIGAITGTAASFLNAYLFDLRITKGRARYTAAFVPPVAALPKI